MLFGLTSSIHIAGSGTKYTGAVPVVTISEATAVGVSIAYAQGYDINYFPPWAALNWVIIGGDQYASTYFAIDRQVSGVWILA